MHPQMEKDSIRVIEHQKILLSDAMMLVAFPGTGWAGSVAAYYLIETLKLKWIASMTSLRFPPIAVIRNGMPMPGIAVYGGPVSCGVDGKYGKLVVITAEFVPHPSIAGELSQTIFAWAKKKRIREIIIIESIASSGEGSDRDIRVIATTRAKKDIRRLGLESLDDGLFTGFAGQLSVEAQLSGFPAITLMVSAREGSPDAYAAARILEIIAPLMPALEIDPKPLFERAREIEQEMQRKNQASRRALSTLSKEATFMFG
jgi:predicted ATP-grasp superfamily ATP-dependent carboligase